MNPKGKFIVFEGIDGSGKSTQLGLLASHIRKKDKYANVLLTREPTFRANELRKLLEAQGNAFENGEQMAGLFVQDRKKHYSEQISHELAQRSWVLCDRYLLSTLAYQLTQGVDLEKLAKMHKDFGIPAPDITFFVDAPAEIALKRISAGRAKKEKFEQQDFLEKLRHNYLSIIYDAKYRDIAGHIVVINGAGTIEQVLAEIAREFDKFYGDENSAGEE